MWKSNDLYALQKRLISLWIASLILSGCTMWQKLNNKDAAVDEPVGVVKEVTKREKADRPEQELALKDERDLKVAKLWARVDELEEESFRQKERIVILERGLTLGLVPEELKYPERAKKAKVNPVVSTSEVAPTKSSDVEKPVPSLPATVIEIKKSDESEKTVTKAATPDREEYELAVAAAHDSFRSGRYGRAIVEYSAIGKSFGDQIDGAMHLYWIAKSWANLKEFNTARQLLSEFVKKHGDSPWAPRARLDLGRVEWQMGLRESALATFKAVIQKYPLADAAEMARMELEGLDKKL